MTTFIRLEANEAKARSGSAHSHPDHQDVSFTIMSHDWVYKQNKNKENRAQSGMSKFVSTWYHSCIAPGTELENVRKVCLDFQTIVSKTNLED